MKTIPYEKPTSGAEFPTDTILKKTDYAGGSVTFYVYDGQVLRETRSYPSASNRSAHYRILNELREKYPGFEISSGSWNPLNYRTDGSNYTPENLPVEFVEACM